MNQSTTFELVFRSAIADLIQPNATFTVIGCYPKQHGQLANKTIKLEDYCTSIYCFQMLKKAYKVVQLSEQNKGQKRCLLSYNADEED